VLLDIYSIEEGRILAESEIAAHGEANCGRQTIASIMLLVHRRIMFFCHRNLSSAFSN